MVEGRWQLDPEDQEEESVSAPESQTPPRVLEGAHRSQRADRAGDFTRLADVLSAAAAGWEPVASSSSSGATQADRHLGHEITRLWPQVVGPEIAANAKPVYLSRRRLVVSTSSSAWAQTLHLMSEDILRRLNECLDLAGLGRQGEVREEALEGIVFRHAGWEEEGGEVYRERPPAGSSAGISARASERPPRGVEFSPEEQEALASVSELDLPADLKETMLRAMRASFVRRRQDSIRP